MFVFTERRQVKDWPATIKIAQDGGKTISADITLDLNLLPVDEYQAKLADGTNKLLDAVLEGFSGISDTKEQPLKDTPANRQKLYQHAPFTDAVFTAYRQANSGEAARKNS
ncbi:hypothetical protein G3R49_12425 [Shewanella sp. WXL01]|uniref:hypothetical protein n=1 Tax=Shewanella sp. WXL01 TaxID=2709721 RepID=UPI001438308A|nr:hypothetical protein [Shewanella sp. WXL01]NKF51363.1 hypothetical protein [Shewanella sp. WXL01]